MNAPVRVGLAAGEADWRGILALQRASLKGNLTPEQAGREGFVTLVHTPELLRRLHADGPSVIATVDAEIVGYALFMSLAARPLVPGLAPMFEELARAEWRGAPLMQQRFYVMGQVCVAARFRGSGLFASLYAEHDAAYGARFDCMVTEVSSANPRSLRAHAKVGFEPLVRYGHAHDEWHVLVRALGTPRPA